MNFEAEANSSASNNEKAKESLYPPWADRSLETGLAPLVSSITALAQNDFLLIELQDKSKCEEYKRINLTLNKEANFIKFLNEFSEGNKIFFSYEKPKNYLLGFLSSESESLSDTMRISLYKQSIEIILKLKEVAAENFEIFNAHLFFVEYVKDSFPYNYPILKLLYHGKKLKINIWCFCFVFFMKFVKNKISNLLNFV
jgi:hypothetical protein